MQTETKSIPVGLTVLEYENAQHTVERFTQRFDTSYYLLTYHAALPLVLTPELLNYLYSRFLRGWVPWIAISDLLLSELCTEVGYETYVMDTAVRVYLLEEMRKKWGPIRMKEVAQLLLHYTRQKLKTDPYLSSRDRQAQQWTAMAYLDEHRETVVHEISNTFQEEIMPFLDLERVDFRMVDKAELGYLSQIVRILAPELKDYPELIEYAQEVSQLMCDSSLYRQTQVLDSEQKFELNFPNAVRTKQDLFGRQADLRAVLNPLTSGKSQPTVIMGERRIGKTSFLNVLAAFLKSEGDPINKRSNYEVLFLPGSAIYSLRDYILEILGSLSSCLGKNVQETNLLSEDGQLQTESFGQIQNGLQSLLENNLDKTFIITIDEFDAILMNCSEPEARKIETLTRYLVQNTDLPISFILTMTHIEDQIERIDSPFINIARIVSLTDLSQEETTDMVTKILAANEQNITVEAVERIYELSRGHPFFIKAILNQLLRGMQPEDLKLSITPEIIKQSAEAAVETPEVDLSLRNIFEVHFSPEQRGVLLFLVENKKVTIPTALKSSTQAVQSLVKRGYLIKDETGNYELKYEFFALWLRASVNYEEYLQEYEQYLEVFTQNTPQQELDVDIIINEETKEVFLKGELVHLSLQEYKVLVSLGRNVNKLVNKEQLAEAIWPEGEVTDQQLAAVISRLRKKLSDGARHPVYIETMPKAGFVLHRAAFVPSQD